MLRRLFLLGVGAFVWAGSIGAAAAQHQRAYEFDGTHIAVSIERFMGIDYTDYDGPRGGDASARLLINADEPSPSQVARLGFDVFIERLSIGIAGGLTSEDTVILAPRVGYMFGLTPEIGLWLRGGAFYAGSREPDYVGIYGDLLFHYFPYSYFAFHIGPTIDVAFADDPWADYVSIGILQAGVSAWF